MIQTIVGIFVNESRLMINTLIVGKKWVLLSELGFDLFPKGERSGIVGTLWERSFP